MHNLSWWFFNYIFEQMINTIIPAENTGLYDKGDVI